MTTATADRLPSVSDLRRLKSPTEQLKLASGTITKAVKAMDQHALVRNAAAVLLFERGQKQDPPMQPAAMWRDTITVSRSLWHKITDEADPARLVELQQEADELLADIAQAAEAGQSVGVLARQRDKVMHKLSRHRAQVGAVKEMRAELDSSGLSDAAVAAQLDELARAGAKGVRAMESLIESMKKYRDQLAVGLMNGGYGSTVANAEVARITGLSTARVAQLRQLR